LKTDWLIVGAGFTGAVLAERIASQLNQSVLLVDQRDHIGGNAYDRYDEHGVLIHQYGPHIFHTNAKHVWQYLSRFTQWHNYQHRVQGIVDGQPVPIPFNLNTLYALFPPPFADKLSVQLVEQFGYNVKVPILKLRESSDGDLKFLAEYIYEKVFKHYTQKQWELSPEDLGAGVTSRVPILVSRDDRYFQDTYQGMPKLGYTELFRNMLKNPNIRVLLKARYQDVSEAIQYKRMVFTGPIDEYFDHCHGHLPYRSLRFEFFHDVCDYKQTVATVNYPNEYDFTRTTEFKRLTQQHCYGTTWIEEYPQVHRYGENDPYYPIPQAHNKDLLKKYQAEAEKLAGQVIFAGRLADYQYYNMDQAVARALSLFDKAVVGKS
jgi:UDP-galactopyranose mutase